MFQQLFDEYFNHPPRAISPVPTAVVAPRAVDPAGSPSSTTIDQDVPSASSSPTTQEIQSQVTHQVLTRSQLQGHAIWCYFDANDNPIPLVGNDVVEIYYLKGRIMVMIFY
nr:hypothetical protein [Tanacetum cinerariifolium]